MRYILSIIAATLLLAGCQKQRDLYGVSHPMLRIVGDWSPSLGESDMSYNATAVLYKQNGGTTKEYFLSPNSVTTNVTRGTYDIFIFNGLMYSPDDTHLDNICFRGTSSCETFEACANEAPANKRLTTKAGEVIASNEMGILAHSYACVEVTGNNEYYIKYKDGKNGFPVVPDYVEATLPLTPRAVSYYAQVTVDLVNPQSAFSASGALRGFAGSVFLCSRMPSHNPVTYHLRLNNMDIYDEGVEGDPLRPAKGTIESLPFATFGPPLDLPGRSYEFEITVTLRDNTERTWTIDVTDQITPIIAQITANLDESQPQTEVTIPINISLTLPVVADVSGSIGVGEWGEDEIIIVPIRP